MNKILFWKTAAVSACALAVISGGVTAWSLNRLHTLEEGISAFVRSASTYVPREQYNAEHDIMAVCQRDLRVCKSDLAQSADTEQATSTREYILDGAFSLIRQAALDDRMQTFWLMPRGKSTTDAPENNLLIGAVSILPSPDQTDAFSLTRLNDGMYLMTGSADYTEASESTNVWIDPNSGSFLSLNARAPSAGEMKIAASGYPSGILAPHLTTPDCIDSPTATVDRLTWNGETAYTFPTPLVVACDSIFDIPVVRLFKEGSSEPLLPNYTKGLKSLSFILANGRTLTVAFGVGTSPKVTVR